MTQVNSNTTTLFVSTRRVIRAHVRALIESHSGGYNSGPGGFVGLECRRDAVHELDAGLKHNPSVDLRVHRMDCALPSEAAAKLRCSIKTLNGHVAGGRSNTSSSATARSARARCSPTPISTNSLPLKPERILRVRSIATRARHTGTSTSKSKVIAFTAVPRPRPGGKRKK